MYSSSSFCTRFHELSVMLRQRDTELELLKKRYRKLQTTYDEVVQEFEKRLDIAKDKEMQLIRVSAV
jgi:archaellum component FlaC